MEDVLVCFLNRYIYLFLCTLFYTLYPYFMTNKTKSPQIDLQFNTARHLNHVMNMSGRVQLFFRSATRSRKVGPFRGSNQTATCSRGSYVDGFMSIGPDRPLISM